MSLVHGQASGLDAQKMLHIRRVWVFFVCNFQRPIVVCNPRKPGQDPHRGGAGDESSAAEESAWRPKGGLWLGCTLALPVRAHQQTEGITSHSCSVLQLLGNV